MSVRGFKPYRSYKDSGEWLVHIPKHWELKPLKRVFGVVNGSTPKSMKLNTGMVTYRGSHRRILAICLAKTSRSVVS